MVVTPVLAAAGGEWPADSFPGNIAHLGDVTAQVVSLASLVADKSSTRDDQLSMAKDAADVRILSQLRT